MAQTIQGQLQDILIQLQADAVAIVPRLAAAIILMLLALVFAFIIERALRAALVRIRFDGLLRRAGVDLWLHRVGIRQPMNDFLPRVVYFMLLFVFARSAANLLGLTALSDAIAVALGYLPRLITALAILLIGGALATFIGRAVQELAAGAGLDFAGSLGSAASGLTGVVLTMMALAQLGVDTELLRLLVGLITAGLMLAMALSFGFGTRDLTRSIIAGFYARRTFRIGEALTVGGEEGTLTAITPTQTLLQQGDRTVAVPNTAFLDGIARQ